MKFGRLAASVTALALAVTPCAPAFAADAETLDKAAAAAAAYMSDAVKNPGVGSVGGDWAVVGLARGGYAPDDYFQIYRGNVERYVEERGGVLHDRKYTEYSRVILGLTAAGHDPRDVAGHDLTKPLEDFEKTVWQGVNGPIFALIALDSADYANGGRDAYVAEILSRQLDDGGWNQAGGGSAGTKNLRGDPDLTGMALQALAKYRSKPEVKAAADRALDFLSEAQDRDGGYSSWNSENSESVVQVLVALCELGVPVDDARFVKNGKTVLDNLLTFQEKNGSFRHMSGGAGDSRMSTEQALYGLVAARRARDGENGLYSMDDAVRRGGPAPAPAGRGLPGKNADVSAVAVTKPGATFTDVAGHAGREAAEALAARGILSGAGDGGFAPDANVTRAEFAKIVAFSLGLPEKAGVPFTDVGPSAWYAKPVATAHAYGIVNGVGGDEFNPSGMFTRQEAAVMVARAAKLCGMDTDMDAGAVRDALAPFADYRTVADWARGPLAFCYAEGVLDDDALEIEPSEAVRRHEIAEMLYRTLKKADLL
jgi:hypothetical protein